MNRAFKKTAYVMIIAVLTTVLLLCGISAHFYAKYITSFGTQNFSLDVDANYKVTFDADGGTMRYPEEAGGMWIEAATASAAKVVEVGKTIGWDGTDDSDFPGEEASDANAPVREGYRFEGWGYGLPGGLREVEYIESTGTQYINTGYKPTSETSYEISFSGYEIPTNNSEHIIFGAGTAWTNLVGINHSKVTGRSNTIPYIRYDGVSSSLPQQEAGTYRLDKTGFYFNGELKYTDTVVAFDWSKMATDDYEISICYLNKSFNPAIKPTAMRIHSFKIWEEGRPVFNGIPCYGEDVGAGLYDTVSQHFFGNEGTGDFIAGPYTHSYDEKYATAKTVLASPNDVLLKATWIANQYTVRFNANGGTGSMSDMQFTYGIKQSLTANAFARKGYTFSGWNTAADGSGTDYENQQEVKNLASTNNAIVDLYAKWNINNYKVTFDATGGTLRYPNEPGGLWSDVSTTSAAKTITYGDTYGWNGTDNSDYPGDEASDANAPVRTGYVFKGWNSSLPGEYTELAYIESDGNQYINTGYKPCTDSEFEIKYSDYSIPTKDVEHVLFGAGTTWGELVGVNNSKSGARSNTIPYIIYDGVGCSLPQQENATYYLDKTGFYFNGEFVYQNEKGAGIFDWSDKTGSEYEITVLCLNKRDKPFTAVAPTACKLHYFRIWENGDAKFDGVPCKNSEGICGLYDKVSGEFFESIGTKAFIAGPEIAPSGIVTSTTVMDTTNDHTLYAIWDEDPVAITFDANGDYGEPIERTFLRNVENDIEEIIFEREGYRIAEWNTSPDGLGKSYDVKLASFPEATTLYAQWTPMEYTITYHANNRKNGYFVPDDDITLPSEYRRLEYIEMDGSQYIDTGFIPNQDTGAVFDGEISENKPTGSERFHTLYGCDNTNVKTKAFGAWFNDTAYGYDGVLEYGDNQSHYGSGVKLNAELNKRFVAESSKNEFSWHYYGEDTIQYAYTFDYRTFSAINTLYLFNLNRAGEKHDSILSIGNYIGKCYSAQIYDNGDKVRDFVPCYRIADEKPGLYDCENDEFYTNDGTKDFILGPEEEKIEVTEKIAYNQLHTLADNIFYQGNYKIVSWNTQRDGKGRSYETLEEVKNLVTETDNVDLYAIWEYNPTVPEQYTKLQYLETTGTQHIDTGFYPNQDTKAIFDGEISENKAKAELEYWHTLYACDNANYNRDGFGAWFNDTNYDYNGVLQYGNKGECGSHIKLKAELNKRFVAESDKNSFSWKYYGDEENQYTRICDYITFTAVNTLYLFNLNRYGSTHEQILTQGGFIGKFYSAQIYDNGELVRDFVPVKRKADEAVGVYDMRNDVFYENAGTGSFIAGPSVNGGVLTLNVNDGSKKVMTVKSQE